MAREQSLLVERVINIGRRNAAERLTHFLIEIKVRLNVDSEAFELPMNQSIIGDALSLSTVHVCRTFGHLRRLGLIETHGGRIRIRDLDRLVDFAGFDRTYLDSHCNWVRQARIKSGPKDQSGHGQ